MMQISKIVGKTIRKVYMLLVMMCLSQVMILKASELEYQEYAADIIMNSLQGQPKYSFLKKLYTQLFFVPAWMDEKRLFPAARELFSYIENDGTLDKTGKLYKNVLLLKDRAEEIYTSNANTVQKIDLEFKISQLYEAYTNYAYFGSINWGAFNARISNLMVNDVNTEWVLHRPNVDAISMLEKAALGSSLEDQLEKAVPSKYHYKALRKELVKYRKIKDAGGWKRIPAHGVLKLGAKHQGVHLLRERLRATGDYKPCKKSTKVDLYDICLQKAVKHFQKRNGLRADGEVGAGTLRALNKTVDNRITTILLNLDRIKWLKNRQSKRHVIINIPDFMLYFEEDGKLRQTIRTIVGKPNHPTPIFSNTVQSIVLNPYWNLPTSIIQKEMIPKLLQNSNAMRKKGIEIYSGWGKNAKKINPKSIDWTKYLYSKDVPFRFAQLPGARNALGKVKFLFPNKFAVYMHDTPTKKLFKRRKRAFSHGCIRLQKPRKLLKTFARFNPNLTFEKSQQILKGKEKSFISLEEKVPVDVIYLTAWVDYEGNLQFRNDIYGYDAMQLKSFRRW